MFIRAPHGTVNLTHKNNCNRRVPSFFCYLEACKELVLNIVLCLENSAVKSSGPGISFVGSVLIINPISLFVISLFRLSISS